MATGIVTDCEVLSAPPLPTTVASGREGKGDGAVSLGEAAGAPASRTWTGRFTMNLTGSRYEPYGRLSVDAPRSRSRSTRRWIRARQDSRPTNSLSKLPPVPSTRQPARGCETQSGKRSRSPDPSTHDRPGDDRRQSRRRRVAEPFGREGYRTVQRRGAHDGVQNQLRHIADHHHAPAESVRSVSRRCGEVEFRPRVTPEILRRGV